MAGAAIVVALAFGVFGVAGYALSSKRLAIRRIAVSGNRRISTGEVHSLLGELIGANLLTADIEASERTGTFWRVDTDADGGLELIAGRL
jgi:cell division septal protein FtsQ